MIAANYTTDLYCDCDECKGHAWKQPENAQYIGTSWDKTAKNARKDGWRISKDQTRCYAPGHKMPRGA